MTVATTAAIEAVGLSKRFGTRQAVDRLHLTVRPGEIYGFLGPNGAGKTTTILMLMGIVAPDSGEARVGGVRVTRGALAARRLIGAVSEQPYLYGEMTVLAYLRFFARFYAVTAASRRIDQLLDEAGLGSRREDRTTELSKGLQQKLSLARALLHDPPVLILDEPASGLDPHGTREFREVLLRERGRGRSILLSSHVLSEVERTADRVGILRGGRLVAEGETGELVRGMADSAELLIELDGPADAFAAGLRDVPGVGDVRADGNRLHLRMDDPGEARRLVARALSVAGGVVTRMEERLPTLEDAFVTLTDERLDDWARTATTVPENGSPAGAPRR